MIAINDKFNIIENHTAINNNVEQLTHFFYQYINYNKKTLSDDYINQLLWFISDDNIKKIVCIDIIYIIKTYLINTRNNIRSLINKNKYTMISLNKIIKNILDKILYINNILRFNIKNLNNNSLQQNYQILDELYNTNSEFFIKNSDQINENKLEYILQNFIKICNLYLSEFIISDNIILVFIENEIIKFSINNNSEIKKFTNLIKDLDVYDNTLYDTIIQKISIILQKEFIIYQTTNLPHNLNRINKLHNNISYYKKLEIFYSYILPEIKYYLIQYIYKNFIDIIKNNALDEIELILSLKWSQLNFILENNFKDKYKLNQDFNKQIIARIKSCTEDDLIHILNILKYVGPFINTNTKVPEEYNIKKDNSTQIHNQSSNSFYITNRIQNIYGVIYINELNKIINSENKLIIIFEEIHKLILNKNYIDVIKILHYVLKLQNQELLSTKYYEYLIKRLFHYLMIFNSNLSKTKLDHFLLYEFNNYLAQEQKLYNLLKLYLQHKFLYKIKKVINDIETTIQDNLNFNKPDFIIKTFDQRQINYHSDLVLLDQNNLNCPLNINYAFFVLTCSYQNWPINYNDGLITKELLEHCKNTNLGQIMVKYQYFYEHKYTDRTLVWFPHYGEINIIYLNQNLKMLPIQFMILELFIDADELLFSNVFDANFMKNYSIKFKNDIISSLILSGVLNKINEYLILTKESNAVIFKDNLIDLFFSESQFIQEKNQDELIYSYKDIISSNINHLLKINPLTYSNLYDKIKNTITVFVVNEEIFKITLQHMIEADYIIYNSLTLMYEKIYY